MWAYKSYNDDAPDEPEPRFPATSEDSKTRKTRKGAFPWSSLYTRGKKENDTWKSPVKNNGNFLQRSKSSIRPSPRTPSLTASLLSRRSGYDDRLDRITKMLELLVEDKARKGSRRDSDCEDDASEEDPSISSRRGRQSLRSRDSGSTLSRQRSPHHARYGSLEPGFQDRQLAYQGPQNERKKGFSSYVKSGVKEAAKLGFKQVKESMLGQTPEDSADTLARSQFQLRG